MSMIVRLLWAVLLVVRWRRMLAAQPMPPQLVVEGPTHRRRVGRTALRPGASVTAARPFCV